MVDFFFPKTSTASPTTKILSTTPETITQPKAFTYSEQSIKMSGLLKKTADVVTGEEHSKSQFQLHGSDKQGSESASPDKPARPEGSPQDSYGTHPSVHYPEPEQSTSFEDMVSGHGAHGQGTHVEEPQVSHAPLRHGGDESSHHVDRASQTVDPGENTQDGCEFCPSGSSPPAYEGEWPRQPAGLQEYTQDNHDQYGSSGHVAGSNEQVVRENYEQDVIGQNPQDREGGVFQPGRGGYNRDGHGHH